MIIQKLQKAQVLHPPSWLADNCVYLTIMGSQSYGVSSDNSDMDIYGICIPPKNSIFPHLSGEIHGFGHQIQRFDMFQQHHVRSPDSTTMYDFSIYGIVKFFQLLMENNPNITDSVFTPLRCIIHNTQIGVRIRESRTMFLHRGAFYKFKGYAYSMLHKIKSKANASNPKRAADIEKVGYDTKFAYHLVRLACEAEQILLEGTLDLERNREQLKSIRRGEWTLEQLERWFEDKEKALENLYASSPLPAVPDEVKIKALLMECLEIHFGNLDDAIKKDVDVQMILTDLDALMNKYRKVA